MAGDVSASLDRLGFYLMVAGFILGGLAFAVSSTSAYLLYRSSSLSQAASNERIAAAQKKTAALEVRAASLNREAQQLKAELTWRRLTEEQAQTLVRVLKAHQGLPIQVQGVYADPEAAQFHHDIYSTFEAAGLKPTVYTGLERATGLWVASTNDSGVAALQNAFSAAGIELHRRPDHGFGAATDKLVVVVGSKPPRFFSSPSGPEAVNWYEQAGRHQ